MVERSLPYDFGANDRPPTEHFTSNRLREIDAPSFDILPQFFIILLIFGSFYLFLIS